MAIHQTNLCASSCSIYLHVFFLFSICLLCLQPTITAIAPTNETDRLALLKFKESVTHDPDNRLSSWNDSMHFCNWLGITCGRRHQRVTALNLNNFKLRGPISPYIGNLSFLRSINLQNTSFYGKIPQEVKHLSRLQALNLNNNTLEGNIPSSLSNCSNLRFINLHLNKLKGKIPAELGLLLKLEVFQVSRNNLTGGIPSSLGNISSLRILTMASNNLVGNIPDAIGRLKVLERFSISVNKISGMIPSSLYNVSSLQVISVSYNQLSGTIPANIGLNLPNVLLLPFAGNEFSGPIPTSLCNATQLQRIDLGENKFSGLVPKKPKKNSSSLASTIDLLPNVSYGMLEQATNGFSSSNLIGSGSFGSVYKGVLHPEETLIAVKVLNLKHKGASKSFMAECNILRNIRHRNLVKILTCCSSMDYGGNQFKALVFEFMTNGSLDIWLHPEIDGEDQTRDLSLLQRLNVAIDVASALNYLHNHSVPPIIHCDLKPSNILLDNDMVAHVSDFGLARLLSTTDDSSQKQTSTIGIKGSIGYVAPEYGMGGEASTEGDTYSYGIFLLEMFLGKRPTDEMFKDGLNLHNFVKMALPERLVQIVEPILLQREVKEMPTTTVVAREDNNENEIEADEETHGIVNQCQMDANVHKCLVLVLEIGLACSSESPKERMNMEEVTKELHLIKNTFLGSRIQRGGLS
ncbi:probable LRR receptor-like serine/threonine-protein kinase At3g47570 [Quercus suber]|uniref:probable LRR receptor-like serine/threonine-protein kinase At3g47570 n=1 Tax=Quercus suber TaxID=58331 RepID=UPI0032DE2C19